MKIGYWAVALVVLAVGAAWSAEPGAQGVAEQEAVQLPELVSDFERNVALGTALSMRAGTPMELDEVDRLAREGLAAARRAVANRPESAEVSYWLGSWLLYGYRVVEARSISIDARGGQQERVERRAMVGLSEEPEEGLAALLRATELAPGNGQYVLDYAAALMDCEKMLEATAILKGVWAGEPELSVGDKIQAGLLLSDIEWYEGRLREAREWVYAALSLEAAGARAVERLRRLDVQEAAGAAEEGEVGMEEWWEAEGEEEGYYEEDWSESGTEGATEGEEEWE